MELSERSRIATVGMLAVVLAFVGCGTSGTTTGPAPSSGTAQRTDQAPRRLVQVSADAVHAITDPKNLAAVLDAVEQARSTIPRSAFDVRAKAAELGKDVDAIFAFARDQVRGEVYEGVLRGPRGTLMALAGNSFDKSSLLGALLTHHGIEVRYVRGRLSDERAKELVFQMFASAKIRNPAATRPSPAAPQQVLTALREMRKVSVSEWLSNVDLLRTVLPGAQLDLSSEPPVSWPVLVREAADHLWLEYREGDRWIPLDPSMKGARPGETFVQPAEAWLEIPLSLLHRVTIRVVVEERGSNGVRTWTALQHEATAADLNGALVTFRHHLDSSAAGWIAAPLLQFENRAMKGEVVAGAGFAGGVERLGKRLFPRPGEPPARTRGELTAEWLEFDFIYPSGRTETLRREIFDRIGPAARAQHREAEAPLAAFEQGKTVPVLMSTMLALSFRSGWLHPGLPVARLAEDLPQLRQAFQTITSRQTAGRKPTEKEAKGMAVTVSPVLRQLLDALATSFYLRSQKTLSAVRPPGVLFYEASPRLVVAAILPTGTGTGADPSATVSLDLRRNEIRAVAEEGVPGRRVLWANALRGVLDGAHEHALIREAMVAARDLVPPASTVAVMSRARETGTSVGALSAREEIQRLNVPDDVRARMLSSLDDGIVLVTPMRMVSLGATARLGWWRVNRKSGEVLAVMDNGLHFTVGEYLLSVAIMVAIAEVSVPLYLALIQWYQWDMEELPGCLDVGPPCAAFGPPPPGCYYENSFEGSDVYIITRCD